LSRFVPLLTVAVFLGPAAGGARTSTDAEQIHWVLDEEQAFVESSRTGKPVLVDAWAEWCTACKLMDRGTWTDPAVRREVARHFVPLRLDFTEEAPRSDPRKDTYGVQALPTVLCCRARGCPPASARRAIGFLRPAEMLAFLEGQR
jgi:thioredoxin:protein disulfide reductase